MARAGRIITDMELCDIVTDNTLTVLAAWTCLIVPSVTTRNDVEQLIYGRGVHLEDRLAALQQKKAQGPTTFPAIQWTINELMNSVDERFTALTTSMRTDRRQGRGGRGREGRGRGRRSDISGPRLETRTCYGCGKIGHIRPNSPDREHEDTGGPSIAFPPTTFIKEDYYDELLAAGTTHPPDPLDNCVVDSGANNRHCFVELLDFDKISYQPVM